MRTKIILALLFLLTCIWHSYKHGQRKDIKKNIILYLMASLPVLTHTFFGGVTWFYGFIGIIIWVAGFYFGEILMWWGIWVLTIGSNFWYFGILGPLLITFLPRFKKFRGLLA